MERVSLREQVAWALSKADPEDLLMAGEDYMRMGAVKLSKSEPPTPFQLEGEVAKAVLVVGGGVAGPQCRPGRGPGRPAR